MSNCFTDIIGIKGQCGTPTEPSSGLYVQDLPFFDLKVADKLLETEESNVAFLQDKLNYAYNTVKNEVAVKIAPMFKQKSVLENSSLGWYKEDMNTIAKGAFYRGIKVRIEEYPFLAFKISSIALYSSDFTGNKTIYVFDLKTGQTLDSFEIALIAGEISYVPINRKYLTERQNFDIFIAYDATDVDSFTTTANKPTGGCFTCNRTYDGYNGRYMIFDGGQIAASDAKLASNVDYTGYTSGLSIQYTLECSPDGFICSMKDRLAYAMLHKLGVILCEELLAGSKRINSVTTIDKSKAEYLHPIMAERYETALKDALFNLQAPSDICFRCNQGVKSIIRIP